MSGGGSFFSGGKRLKRMERTGVQRTRYSQTAKTALAIARLAREDLQLRCRWTT
jgi:hypothetical protein